jgi:hypothetical protein
MKAVKWIAGLLLGAVVAGCGAMPDIPSRNAPFETTPVETGAQTVALKKGATAQAPRALPMTVTGINVTVPQTLTVSEANRYYPRADIVWRGDPIGPRHRQIKAIVENAFAKGTADMSGATAVTIDAKVVRFHSLSEKSRYTIGGVHNITFDLTVRRASTGEPLGPTRRVETNLHAFGGAAAIEADRNGQTQKVRVTDHLAKVIRHELGLFVAC